MSDFVRLDGECGSCGGVVDLCKGQAIRDGRLRWEVDWQCTACGIASCDRGREPAPPWVRDELELHRVKLTNVDVRVLKAFRAVLGLSLAEVRGEIAVTGVEVRFVADLLRREGVDIGPLAAIGGADGAD